MTDIVHDGFMLHVKEKGKKSKDVTSKLFSY